jgi:hypothetical protein
MVVNPGWPQLASTLLVLVGTAGITFAMFGNFFGNFGGNVLLRALLAMFSFVVLLHPSEKVSMATAAPVLIATLYGVWRHRQIGGPALSLQPQPVQ